MLLLSNPRKCDDQLATQLSYLFVAYTDDGAKVYGLKSFDTATQIGTNLMGGQALYNSWKLLLRPMGKITAEKRAVNLKKLLAEKGHSFISHVEAWATDSSFTSFCAPKELLQAHHNLWTGKHRFSLRRRAWNGRPTTG